MAETTASIEITPPLDPRLVAIDRQLNKKKEDRWNALIDSASPVFQKRLQLFQELLRHPAVTIDDILETYFDKHERSLIRPARTPPSVVELQAHNTQRYRQIVRRRFPREAVTSPLPLKLTLLHFGFPVEPLVVSVTLAEGMAAAQEEETDTVREHDNSPPLLFLTAYDRRNFGYDHLKGTYRYLWVSLRCLCLEHVSGTALTRL